MRLGARESIESAQCTDCRVRMGERAPTLRRSGALTGSNQSLNHQRIALLQQDACRESYARLLEKSECLRRRARPKRLASGCDEAAFFTRVGSGDRCRGTRCRGGSSGLGAARRFGARCCAAGSLNRSALRRASAKMLLDLRGAKRTAGLTSEGNSAGFAASMIGSRPGAFFAAGGGRGLVGSDVRSANAVADVDDEEVGHMVLPPTTATPRHAPSKSALMVPAPTADAAPAPAGSCRRDCPLAGWTARSCRSAWQLAGERGPCPASKVAGRSKVASCFEGAPLGLGQIAHILKQAIRMADVPPRALRDGPGARCAGAPLA